MAQVGIEFLPDGDTKPTRDQAKGHLLEQLVGEYLHTQGYPNPDLNHRFTGGEWDVTGRGAVTGAPLIVSCKCRSEPVNAEPLRLLGFDVHNKAREYPTVQGLMVALPHLTTEARDYWDGPEVDDAIRGRITVLEEQSLIQALCGQQGWRTAETVAALIRERHRGTSGETRILYREGGALWAQLVLRGTERAPQGYYLLQPDGTEVTVQSEIQQVTDLLAKNKSDLAEMECLNGEANATASEDTQPSDHVQAHVVTPGTGWFDYKFPAPPACFVGRQTEVDDFVRFIAHVSKSATAARTCVVTGPSGIGKSSLLLKMGEQAAEAGAKLVPISSMSARGKGFLVAAVVRFLQELRADPDTAEIVRTVEVAGRQSLPSTLADVGGQMAEVGLIPVLFFDQFETALLDPALAEAVVELAAGVEERAAHFIIGFCWKTDLWWPDDNVPYTAYDNLRRRARVISVSQFGPEETNLLLQALEDQIGEELEAELAEQIREFSRGYPWLLKKVCWHTQRQLEQGATQSDLVERQLELKSLFEEDIEGLDGEETQSLKLIAAALPADSRTLAEGFPERNVADALNKFVDMRLVVREGETYNVYHDIFGEFLRRGRVPIDEVYLLHISPKKALEVVQKLADAGAPRRVDGLAEDMDLTTQSLYNYVRDLRAIGLVELSRGTVTLHADAQGIETEEELMGLTRQRLVRNTCAKQILERWENGPLNSLAEVKDILRAEFPSVEAQESTWDAYASAMVRWLNYVRAAGEELITVPGVVKAERLVGAQSTAEQPEGYVSGTTRLVGALRDKGPMPKEDILRTIQRGEKTVEKSLVDARLMGLCERLVDGRWRLTDRGKAFAQADQAERSALIRDRVRDVPFVGDFYQGLQEAGPNGVDARELVRSLAGMRGKTLARTTTKSLATIVGSWLEFAQLVEREGTTCRIPPDPLPMNQQ